MRFFARGVVVARDCLNQRALRPNAIGTFHEHMIVTCHETINRNPNMTKPAKSYRVMKKVGTGGLIIFSIVSYVSLGRSASHESGFVEQKLMMGMTISQYQIYVPEGWMQHDSWPVILYLHGAGERGTDGKRQTQVGLGAVLRQDPNRVPAVVVFPQCREGASWVDPDMEQLALLSLEQAIREFKGDQTRIYLTGISMGGQGTWYLAMKYPHRFAALAPIAGRTRPALRKLASEYIFSLAGSPLKYFQTLIERIHALPIWVFHGQQDQTVPVEETRMMVRLLRENGSSIRYTEYPSIGHASWESAYAEPNFFPWLFSHHEMDNGVMKEEGVLP